MSESNMEPEAQPSTSQSSETQLSTSLNSEPQPSTSQSSLTQKTAITPVVSQPKIVLERLDLNNLPVLQNSKTSPVKKPIKRLVGPKNKPIVSKTTPKNIAAIETPRRGRGRPKKNYKLLSEYGKTPVNEIPKLKTTAKSSRSILKRAPKMADTEEDNSVRGMLKKTMLQKRSKIVIPPAKKSKLMPSKTTRSNSLPPKLKKDKPNSVTSPPKKEVSPKLKEVSFKMDTNEEEDEDEFLYDELIDELVNSPNKKVFSSEKKTNITLKPNVGNKPPTIVKGGIVKKSSLPPDLKSVASPTTLNSSKLTGTALHSKSKASAMESLIKTPATADTPKASLPVKASPFPIAMNSSPPKDLGKKALKKPTNSIMKEDQPLNVNTPPSSIIPSKISPKPKPAVPGSRPRGRPRIGPKQVIKTSPVVSVAVDEESDEYTEVETLENIESDPVELLPDPTNDSNQNDEIQVLAHKTSKASVETDVDNSRIKSKEDEDPHLDLLRILTDDTEDVQVERTESKGINSESPRDNLEEATEPNITATAKSTSPDKVISSEKSSDHNIQNPGERASNPPTDESISVQNNETISDNANKLSEPNTEETEVEETPPVRTIYDLMKDVSLQYPSWNLHIIPETNAFCIAQVTKGRLGLPTLKKCIELDADTYSAKVYIHQYHIKRFDGVYDSEEAILALIEEIHSIKA